MLSVEILSGERIDSVRNALAELRSSVFREWPYLYEGSADYEREYLRCYVQPDAVVVTVRDGEQVVGAATAMPLLTHSPDAAQSFTAAGLDPAGAFYFGESVLLPAYRGQGLGRRFLDEREAFGRGLGYLFFTFAAVERPLPHPRCPPEPLNLHPLWTRAGFVRREELSMSFKWRDIGERAETEKKMVFWTKET